MPGNFIKGIAYHHPTDKPFVMGLYRNSAESLTINLLTVTPLSFEQRSPQLFQAASIPATPATDHCPSLGLHHCVYSVLANLGVPRGTNR